MRLKFRKSQYQAGRREKAGLAKEDLVCVNVRREVSGLCQTRKAAGHLPQRSPHALMPQHCQINPILFPSLGLNRVSSTCLSLGTPEIGAGHKAEGGVGGSSGRPCRIISLSAPIPAAEGYWRNLFCFIGDLGRDTPVE